MSAIQPSFNRYEQALQLNRDALQSELSAVANATQQTVQLQQQVQQGLSDRVALLEAELAAARRQVAQSTASIQAERVASAAMARENTALQVELAQLRPGDALLRRIMTLFDALKSLGPETWPELNVDFSGSDFDYVDKAIFSDLYICKREKERWEPLIAELRRVGQSGPNGVTRSNPITIQPRR